MSHNFLLKIIIITKSVLRQKVNMISAIYLLWKFCHEDMWIHDEFHVKIILKLTKLLHLPTLSQSQLLRKI